MLIVILALTMSYFKDKVRRIINIIIERTMKPGSWFLFKVCSVHLSEL